MRLTKTTGGSRALGVVAGAVLTVGVLGACSGGPGSSPTGVAAIPQTATFIADIPDANGTTMTMAITVEGDKVVAYATNGTDDEAYFFGTQNGGHMHLNSMYADTITASFDGTKATGEVTMNEPDSAPVEFAAASAAAPAGIYTATHHDMRASYVVRPDRTMVGVMDNSAPGDHKVTDALAARDQAFKDTVRQMRLDRQLQPAPQMTYGTWSMPVDGNTTLTATRVTGDMSI